MNPTTSNTPATGAFSRTNTTMTVPAMSTTHIETKARRETFHKLDFLAAPQAHCCFLNGLDRDVATVAFVVRMVDVARPIWRSVDRLTDSAAFDVTVQVPCRLDQRPEDCQFPNVRHPPGPSVVIRR